ncbi:MAG: hypothetical protein Q8865_06540 [Bacillota bacterium]|nr:hypothetical protein [Bacillota bacterium]
MRKITAMFIVSLTVIFFILHLALPDRKNSFIENRSLAQAPVLSAARVFSGDFRNDTNNYVSDQFPFRDMFIKAYMTLTAKHGNGETYKQIIEGKNGYDYYIYDENQILSIYGPKKDIGLADVWNKKITAIDDLRKELNFDFVIDLVPSKAEALNPMLPARLQHNTDKEIKDRFFSKTPRDIIKIDTMTEFDKKPLDELKKCYLNTDNHWNFYGAYEGFKVLCDNLHRTLNLNTSIAPYNFTEVPIKQNTIVGAYNRNLGDLFTSTEKLAYYQPSDPHVFDDLKLYVLDKDKNEKQAKLSDYIATKTSGPDVDYESLCVADYDYLHFVNPKAMNHYSLVVIKDSFFDAEVPNISLLFDNVYVIDTRYYKNFNVYNFMKDTRANGLMLFYNSTAFMKVEDHLTYDVR